MSLANKTEIAVICFELYDLTFERKDTLFQSLTECIKVFYNILLMVLLITITIYLFYFIYCFKLAR